MRAIHRFFCVLKKDPWALAGLFVLIAWTVVAMAPQFFEGIREIPMELSARLTGPSRDYWLGVDGNGNSLALLIVNGARTSLVVSLCTVVTSLFVGIPLGALAGYFGKWVDILISRFIDILLAFPPMILPIAITAFFGGGLLNVVIALSLTGWVGYARLVRGQFLALRERE